MIRTSSDVYRLKESLRNIASKQCSPQEASAYQHSIEILEQTYIQLMAVENVCSQAASEAGVKSGRSNTRLSPVERTDI